ncbi:MAG TPA: response regulator transcription factor [Clostridia bacterium]|nr:response regulator transcription factor [Clostridia bacterium]
MKGKILLLEDDDSIRNFTKINLMRNEMEVIEATSGEMALRLFEGGGGIDIAILDVMLPGIDGFEVCRSIREKNKEIGIIMLTAKTQDIDKVMGLEFGADDYITKPFSPMELIARVNSLMRRVRLKDDVTEGNTIESGVYKIDFIARKFYKDGEIIELTPTEFLLIKVFVTNPNKALSRDNLLDEVWGKNYIGDLKIVDVNIRRLRQKIEDNPSEPDTIETIWGLGYRWKEAD